MRPGSHFCVYFRSVVDNQSEAFQCELMKFHGVLGVAFFRSHSSAPNRRSGRIYTVPGMEDEIARHARNVVLRDAYGERVTVAAEVQAY